MAQVTLQGKPVNTSGTLPKIREKAPDFLLTKTDLSDVSRQDYTGKRIVLNVFPSIDTSVCATSVRRFNSEIDKLANAVCLCASRDLPFAHSRFCGSEGLDRVIAVSELRNSDLGDNYGLRIIDGPLAGLLARAVVVIDEKGMVLHSQLVPEISDEPDYEAAMKVLQ
ncbi:MAG: thiol peroxidase [Desulfoarculaceae bacterium]|nr:thiol peroxidase [Desulfoarculaceae bacterium]